MPTRPQKAEKRTSGSAKLCAVMAAPHRQTHRRRRTGCRSAHCRARQPIRGRSASAPPLIGGDARPGVRRADARGRHKQPVLPSPPRRRGTSRPGPPAPAAAGAPRIPPHLAPQRRHPARHQPLRKNSFILQSSRSHPPPPPRAQPVWACIPPGAPEVGAVSAASRPSSPGGLFLQPVTWGPAGART